LPLLGNADLGQQLSLLAVSAPLPSSVVPSLYTFLSAHYQLTWLVVGLDDVTRHDTTRSLCRRRSLVSDPSGSGLEGDELDENT
jgi:hypothetical protein